MVIDICLQENAKLRIGNLIKIFRNFSKKVEQWKDDWIAFHGEHENKISGYKSTWELFRLSTSSIDKFSEGVSDMTENLETIRKSIPDPDENQKLELKIKEARSAIDSLDEEIKRLTQENTRLGQKISACKEKSWTDPRNCIDSQGRMDGLLGRQDSTTTLLSTKQSTLRRKLDRFNSSKDTYYQESKVEEIKRCEELKQYATKFFGAFGLKSENSSEVSESCKAQNGFEQVSGIYDAKIDFEQWEKKHFPSDTAKLQRSQSRKKKTASKEQQ